MVRGRTAKLGDKATRTDRIAVDGRVVELIEPGKFPRVILYHKPVGELVTRNDPEGRPTVFRHLPPERGSRWAAVGRLDLNSSGLLLFTDSGELAHRLMHPRHEIEREYAVRVYGELDGQARSRLLAGVELDGDVASFASIEPMQRRGTTGTNRWLQVVLREGRNREVRRLFEAVGLRVSRLVRLRYGSIDLPRHVGAGQWRELSPPEVRALMAEVGLEEGGVDGQRTL
jgi:23S rRNA pseudouridine2605 synthase